MRSALTSAAIALAVFSAPPVAASSEDTPDAWPPPAWETMSMSGSTASLCRLAGVSERLDTSRLTLELIRLLYGERLTGEAPADRSRAAILSYLDALDTFNRTVARAHMPELSSAAAARARLQDTHAVLAFLGITFDPKSPTPWREVARPSDGGDAQGRRALRSNEAAVREDARTAARRQVLSEAGLSPQDLIRRLNQGQTVPLTLPRVSLPLPLSPRIWREVVFHGKVDEDSLFGAIVGDRTAALLYHGLLSLDGETLAYFGSRPHLLSNIARQHPGVFAVCARSIHIRAGQVQLPGGPAAEPLWDALTAARAEQADAFVSALLGRSGGGLAYFYDALAHLDPPHLRFALGTDVRRFRALYTAFVGVSPTWQIEAHPFTRPDRDGAHLLAQLRVESTGALGPPASADLWARAFGETSPTDDEMRARPIALEPAADAAAIAAIVLRPEPGQRRRQRLEALLFAQRVFARARPDEMGSVYVAVQGFTRFETLALTFERIGINDPAVYARAMRCAARLSDLGSPRRVATALSQFQGALALVDRLVSRDALEIQQAARLVESLVAAPLSENGYRGAVATWMSAELLPVLRARLGEPALDSAEDLALEGLAGMRPAIVVPDLPIDWEGEVYRLDPAASELDRLLRVRRKQAGNRLDEALALHAIATSLAPPRLSPAEGRPIVDRLTALVKTLRPPEYVGAGAGSPGELFSRLSETARNYRTSPDSEARKVALAERVDDVADEVLGDVLRSLAYAAAIGDPESNLLLGPDMAAEHDFGVFGSGPSRMWAPWALPATQAGSGVSWHLAGSLLALDLPLARFSLRRISSDQPIQPTRLDPDDEQGLAHTAVLMRPSALTDAARDRLVALVSRGREQAAQAGTPAARAAVLDGINASEWRRNAIEWRVQHGPISLERALTLTELLWIGARSENARLPDAWGQSMVAVDGCLCLGVAGPATLETYGLRPSGGLVASYLSDATLRVAELTAELKLPAALIPAVLLGVTEDVLDTTQPAHADDWIELAETASRVTRERFEDQVAALTIAGGPLVPVR
jgi:hypothetical protein